jgi:hypothetical protein
VEVEHGGQIFQQPSVRLLYKEGNEKNGNFAIVVMQ